MKRVLTILAASLLGITAIAASVSAASFSDLNSYQIQKFWQMWEKDCYQLLVDQKYSEYFTCSTGTLEKASKLVEKAAAWCKDSDGGMDYYNKGVVTTDVYPNGIEDYFYTFSNGKSYLLEGACSSDNRYMYYQKSCKEIGPNYTEGDGVCEEVLDVSMTSVYDFPDFVAADSKDTEYGRFYLNSDQSLNEGILLKAIEFERVGGYQTDNFQHFADVGGTDADIGLVRLYLGVVGGEKGSTKLLQSTYIVQYSKVNFDLESAGVKNAILTPNTFLEIRADVNSLSPKANAKYGAVDAFKFTSMDAIGVKSGLKAKVKPPKGPVRGRVLRKSVPQLWNGTYMLNKDLMGGASQSIYRLTIMSDGKGDVGFRKLTFNVGANTGFGKDIVVDKIFIEEDANATKPLAMYDFTKQGVKSDYCNISKSTKTNKHGTYATVTCNLAEDIVVEKGNTESFTVRAQVTMPNGKKDGLALFTSMGDNYMDFTPLGSTVNLLIGNLITHNNSSFAVGDKTVNPTKTLNSGILWTDYYKNGVDDWTYFGVNSKLQDSFFFMY